MPFTQLGLSDKVPPQSKRPATRPHPDTGTGDSARAGPARVLGIAQTGDRQDGGLTLPMLTMLEHGRARARIARTLIVEPTRELAAQVEESFIKYGVNHKLNVALLIGGVSFDNQTPS